MYSGLARGVWATALSILVLVPPQAGAAESGSVGGAEHGLDQKTYLARLGRVSIRSLEQP